MISKRCGHEPEPDNSKDFPMTDKSEPKEAKKDAKELRPIIHLGMMGDGTEEQNLGERGDPSKRIKEDEVVAAFKPGPKEKAVTSNLRLAMDASTAANDFPVVCVGGSAGGLDAYIRLLQHLPADLGVAIVIVNHLRKTTTLLHEILPRYTKMPVGLITEGLIIRPNHVFIIPAQRDLHVLRGEFRLKPISKPRGWPDVITVFLRSLAKNWSGKLVAVIVSGYDGDGSDALSAIRDVGGVIIAQKLETAQQPDMPETAIESGCVDFVLSPERIAMEIARIAMAQSGSGAKLSRSALSRPRPTA
jgi:two-component system chemotaxis response regulator CheB